MSLVFLTHSAEPVLFRTRGEDVPYQKRAGNLRGDLEQCARGSARNAATVYDANSGRNGPQWHLPQAQPEKRTVSTKQTLDAQWTAGPARLR